MAGRNCSINEQIGKVNLTNLEDYNVFLEQILQILMILTDFLKQSSNFEDNYLYINDRTDFEENSFYWSKSYKKNFVGIYMFLKTITRILKIITFLAFGAVSDSESEPCVGWRHFIVSGTVGVDGIHSTSISENDWIVVVISNE